MVSGTYRSAVPPLRALPPLVHRKLYKTTQSRGATLSEIYQNRVKRNSTVLIPHSKWEACRDPGDGSHAYERGYIVLVEPTWYFATGDADQQLKDQGLELAVNALLLFRRRSDWDSWGAGRIKLPNGDPFTVAQSRLAPLGGNYMARVAQRHGEGGDVIRLGYNTTETRGAGIRVFEYASDDTINATKLQLEALLWLCPGAITDLVDAGMALADAQRRSAAILKQATDARLLDLDRLRQVRAINSNDETMCPFCKITMGASEFLERTEQMEGREVHDLTTTEVSLFHIQELRVGTLQHKPYNLGWGHHFCNTVVRDAGIMPTLRWMREVLDNQGDVEDLAKEAASVEEAVEG